MIKKIIIAIFLFTSLSVAAQTYDQQKNDDMLAKTKSARKQGIIALKLQTAGVLIAATSPFIAKEELYTAYFVAGAGGLIAAVGFFEQMAAWREIKRINKTEGMSYGIQKNGIGLSYTF